MHATLQHIEKRKLKCSCHHVSIVAGTWLLSVPANVVFSVQNTLTTLLRITVRCNSLWPAAIIYNHL